MRPIIALLLALAAAPEEDVALPDPCAQCPCSCSKEGLMFSGFSPFVHGHIGYGYIATEPLKGTSPLAQGAFSYMSDVGGFDWGAEAGVLWALGPVHLGAQIGFSNYRDSNFYVTYKEGVNRNITYRDNNIDLLANVRYNFFPEFGIFLLAGPSYAFEQYKSSTTGQPTEMANLGRITFSFGGGFVYFFMPRIGVTIDSRYSLGKMLDFNKSTAQLGRFAALRSTNLGIVYRF